MSDENITKDWALYEAGKLYNNRLDPNYYDTVDANLAFYNGDQWRNLSAENLPKPVFNVIKRVVNFFVASLTDNDVKVNFEPMLYSDIDQTPEMQNAVQAADMANAKVEDLFNKFKMEFKVKDALFDGAVIGDYCAHFYFDTDIKPYGNAYGDIKGEIEMELVDGTNVFFGNANSRDVQKQPYIIITGRDMVKNLKAEAKAAYSKYGDPNQDPEEITSDVDYLYQAGDAAQIEVETDEYGKALYIIVYRKDKKTGHILASKSVRNAYIYKDVDTGLSLYPVAWSGWEKQKNQYHHRSIVTGIIPNQIFINRMFAMVMYHLMMTAFPKAIYNKDYIAGWDNNIGSAVGVQGLDINAPIKNVAGYLEPGNMSNQIIQTIDYAMQYTKETLGINDAALGDVNPTNTSAIIALQKSSSVPLENPKSNLYEWIEDIGRILLDMMGTYYGERPIIIEDDQGQKTLQKYNFDQFKNVWLDVQADVGEASYWSEISSVQSLDNLLMNGLIDIVDYLERIPDDIIPKKQDLIDKLQQQQQAQPGQPGQPQDPSQLISQLSPQEQQAFNSAPPQIQQQILSQLQSEQQPQQPTPPQGPQQPQG